MNKPSQTLIFDAHLDLSMNAMEWNRDLRWKVSEIRESEKGMTDLRGRENNTVSFPAMRHGNVGLCVATQIARYVKPSNPLPGWKSPEQAWAFTQAQLAWYREMERQGEMVQISDLAGLEAWLEKADGFAEGKQPLGYILSLEGADSMVNPDYLYMAHEYGLRALGPAHYGPGTYAQGTNATGGLGPRGKDLLAIMEELNIILDATHLCDDSFWEALDHFNGKVWASHSLCRSIVNHNRQFTDEQIKELLHRGAVIGMAFDGWMIVHGWEKFVSTPQSMHLTMENILDHLDHICQLAGNADHVGIGSDLDGGFGKEQSPSDVDTIADLQKIPDLLAKRGYSQADIKKIMHGNWLRFLRESWG